MISLPNPFEKANVPLSVDELLDIAFRRAFGKIKSVKLYKDPLLLYRSREIARIQTIADNITSRLEKAVKSFPNIDRLDPFYRELLDVVVGIDDIRHALGALQWASKICKRIARYYIAKIRRTEDPDKMAQLRKEASGRISSVLKRISKEIDFLRINIPKLRKLPDIDLTVPVVIIAGMPNTGKSTLLSRLSTKTPEIAPYPFTTRGLIIGHSELESVGKTQFIDTPGLLDRPLSRRNRIELQAIVALRHLGGIVVYLFDPSETCGYPLSDQISLYEDLIEQFSPDIIAVVNKLDLEREFPRGFLRMREYARLKNIRLIEISADKGLGIAQLKKKIISVLTEGGDEG